MSISREREKREPLSHIPTYPLEEGLRRGFSRTEQIPLSDLAIYRDVAGLSNWFRVRVIAGSRDEMPVARKTTGIKGKGKNGVPQYRTTLEVHTSVVEDGRMGIVIERARDVDFKVFETALKAARNKRETSHRGH